MGLLGVADSLAESNSEGFNSPILHLTCLKWNSRLDWLSIFVLDIMKKELSEALAKRGRRWGENNKKEIKAVRNGSAPTNWRYRPHIVAVSLNYNTGKLQHIAPSGSITHIRPSE